MRAALAEAVTAKVRKMEDFEMKVWITNPDGAQRLMFLRFHPHRRTDGLIYWDGVATDITELSRSKAAVRESEENYRGAIRGLARRVDDFGPRFRALCVR